MIIKILYTSFLSDFSNASWPVSALTTQVHILIQQANHNKFYALCNWTELGRLTYLSSIFCSTNYQRTHSFLCIDWSAPFVIQ